MAVKPALELVDATLSSAVARLAVGNCGNSTVVMGGQGSPDEMPCPEDTSFSDVWLEYPGQLTAPAVLFGALP